MWIGEAKDAARAWVRDHATRAPGFAGAYLAGSTTWLGDDDPLPVGTDVDVMVVRNGLEAPPKLGKFVYEGVLLEVTYVAADTLRSPDVVLADYHVAPCFRAPFVIADPTGVLTALQAAVGPEYARRRWVRARVANARERIVDRLAAPASHDALPGQVLAWLFPTGVTTHMLLVAGLRNPTVRRRYAAVHELLVEYDRADFSEALLDLLGCAQVTRARVEHHLEGLTRLFDATAPCAPAAPFFYASDLTEIARPIAIDGTRAMIEAGDHRAAMFWIVATASRAHTVLSEVAPDIDTRAFAADYRDLLADIGITGSPDIAARSEATLAMLPEIDRVADDLIAANREIRDQVIGGT